MSTGIATGVDDFLCFIAFISIKKSLLKFEFLSFVTLIHLFFNKPFYSW